jgi:hypothetical protein
MGPTQLSPQCRDNLGIGKYLRELDHPAQVLLPETTPEPFLQLSPQRGDNLGAVLGPALFQDVLANASADLPVQRRECDVGGLGELPPRRFDQPADVEGQPLRVLFWDQDHIGPHQAGLTRLLQRARSSRRCCGLLRAACAGRRLAHGLLPLISGWATRGSAGGGSRRVW